jgi:hypothetical protein
MTAAELARRILLDAPGDAQCDACLALACQTTLAEMRSITEQLVAQDATLQPASSCASCRRTVPTIVYRPKCPHCSRRFEAADATSLIGDELLHAHCARRLVTDQTIRLSRALSRRARDSIEESRRRIREGRGGPPLDSSA